MDLTAKQIRFSLVRSLSALIPEALAGDAKFAIQDQDVRIQVRALRDALKLRGRINWPVMRSTIGRLRGLYLDKRKRDAFSGQLIAALRRVVETYPFLKDIVPKKEGKRCLRTGRDGRGDRGYEPQHKSRFGRLVH